MVKGVRSSATTYSATTTTITISTIRGRSSSEKKWSSNHHHHHRKVALVLAFLIVAAIGSWYNESIVILTTLQYQQQQPPSYIVVQTETDRNLGGGDATAKDNNNNSTQTRLTGIRRDEPTTSTSFEDYFESCIQRRGSRGNWYINETMGRETFYPLGMRSKKWLKNVSLSAAAAADQAVYPDNKYAWHDETEDTHGCAPIEAVNKKRFCAIMQQLKMQRLFVVGDSLSLLQINSLLSLLGYDVQEFFPHTKKQKPNTTRRTMLECPNYPPIELRYRRENLGPNLRLTELGDDRTDATRKHRMQFGPEIPYCKDRFNYTIDGGNDSSSILPNHCPWMEEYAQSSKRTLLLLNQGAHFHSVDTFRNSFDLFVQQFQTISVTTTTRRPNNDIVIFRNTAPGHKDCFHVKDDDDLHWRSPPNMTHDKFLDRFGTTLYDWNLFDAYNQHAKQALLEGIIKSQQQTTTTTQNFQTILYLNIYNMTVLRPDGHSAANDCLHYTLPSAADFWNHLLFTNLADYAAAVATTMAA